MSNHQCTHNKVNLEVIAGKLIGKKSTELKKKGYIMAVRPNITVDLTIFGELLAVVPEAPRGGGGALPAQRRRVILLRDGAGAAHQGEQGGHVGFDPVRLGELGAARLSILH